MTLILDRTAADLLAEAQTLAESAHVAWAEGRIFDAHAAWDNAKNLFMNYYFTRDREKSEAFLGELDQTLASVNALKNDGEALGDAGRS